MGATDELRRLLDERGVEWDADDEIMDDGSISQVTYWYSNDIEWSADGRDEYLAFDAVQLITPAQAIAATLGDVPRLPYFWTADGTLHIELPKLPESISVRLPDQRDREVGSARTWQYTRDSDSDATRERKDDARTCHIVKASRKYVLSDGTELFEDGCSVCNGYIGEGDNYCSNCGAKVVDG